MSYFASYTIIRLIFTIIILNKIRINKKEIGLEKYGKNLTFLNLISSLTSQIDKLMIFHFFSATDLAIYSIAMGVPDQIKSLIGPIYQLSFAKYSKYNYEKIKKNIFNKYFKLLIFIFSLIVIYFVLSPLLFKILFPQYLKSILYSQIYSISLLASANILLISALESQKKTNILYKFNFFGPFVLVLLYLYFINYGIIGLVISKVIYKLLGSIYLFFASKKAS